VSFSDAKRINEALLQLAGANTPRFLLFSSRIVAYSCQEWTWSDATAQAGYDFSHTRCPSCRPTNSIKLPKEKKSLNKRSKFSNLVLDVSLDVDEGIRQTREPMKTWRH